MCGIAGAISFQNSSFSFTPDYFKSMCSALSHRGPDGEGIWVSDDRKVGLGHRRLSIIDLSRQAAQPMCNEDATLWISFNGEIYNHAQIRKELDSIGGHRWKTDHSDTEVILRAFEQWGIDCLERFRGMFAIALWDVKKRELWLIRDRIGIKPLYYSLHHDRLVFASEIKAILRDPQQKRALNEEALFHYLSFLTTPAPATLFEGIQKIPAGTWLKVSAQGKVYEHRYWDVLDYASPLAFSSEEEVCKVILDELRTSVNLHKVSDVGVGVFLSGGIDSSTNAALFSEGEKTIKTFSIGYEGNYKSCPSELSYARLMAETIKADHHERLLNIDDLIDFLPRMVYLQDEPIADPVCVPVYYVSKLARDHGIKVCQVGEGADELFWGYPSWKMMLRLQRYNGLPVPNIFKRMGLFGLKGLNGNQGWPYEFLQRGINHQPVFWGGAEAFTNEQKKRLLSPLLNKKFKNFSSWEAIENIYSRFMEKAKEKSTLNWMTYIDLNMRLPELLLMRVDKMSMGVSLEGRVPFLDHKFVELAMSIPSSMKTKNGALKYLLKKSVKGLIPDQLIDRKKQGFGVPIYEWFFDRLGDKTKSELMSFCSQTDIFNKNAVARLIDQRQGPAAWYLLNFALWWKEFISEHR